MPVDCRIARAIASQVQSVLALDCSDAMVRLARRERVSLLHAVTGAEALALVEQQAPNLILLDVQLPDMSGADVLRRLKASPRARAVPVVILTADATPGLPASYMAAGAAAFLTKPLDVREMLNLVDSVLVVQG